MENYRIYFTDDDGDEKRLTVLTKDDVELAISYLQNSHKKVSDIRVETYVGFIFKEMRWIE